MNKYCVYITTTPTGRYYIGKGITTDVRAGKYKGSGVLLRRSLKKHGEENHITLVASTHETEGDAFKNEFDLVRSWGAVADRQCLNLVDGGQGFSSQDSKNMWANPEIRARCKKASKKVWANPEYRARVSEKVKEAWANPERRARQSERTKEVMADSVFKARHKEAVIKAMNDPEVKARYKKAINSPEVKARLKKAMKEVWANSEYRARQSKIMKETMNSPEVKARRAKSLRKTWTIHDTVTGETDTTDNMQEYCDTHRWNFNTIRSCKRIGRLYKGRYRIIIQRPPQ